MTALSSKDVRYYELRGVGKSTREWGRFLLTPDGTLLIYSSYGVYGHWWTHPGMEIRRFIIQCDHDYVAGKFAQGETAYDSEQTVTNLEREICRLRRERRISKGVARDEWKLLADHGDLYDDDSLRSWAEATTLPDFYEHIARCLPFQLQHFMKQVWPAFVERLKEELALEATAPPPEASL